MHSGVDRLAMWLEDRVPHAPQAYAHGTPGPLDCFEPLGPLPDPPRGFGAWSAPSPRPLRRGDRMGLRVLPAGAPFRGTALVVPPWKIASPALVSGYTALLARAGLEPWLLVPPEHMERAAPGARSGQAFASLDLVRFRALFEQLVLEVRTALALAARRGPVGVLGLSIGALAASMAITAEERLDFAALVAPPADLAAVLAQTPIGRRYRALATRAGTTWPPDAELVEVLSPFDPRTRAVPPARLFVGVARHDAIALPHGAVALARAWGVEPRVYARGHLTLLFLCRALRRDLARFVRGSPEAPMRR